MRLIIQKLVVRVRRQLLRGSIAGAIGFGLLTSSAIGQEEVAPGYAPGSTVQKPLELIPDTEWTPPVADVQSSPSDWLPPETERATEVQRLVVNPKKLTSPLSL